jgi:hypothetical protein
VTVAEILKKKMEKDDSKQVFVQDVLSVMALIRRCRMPTKSDEEIRITNFAQWTKGEQPWPVVDALKKRKPDSDEAAADSRKVATFFVKKDCLEKWTPRRHPQKWTPARNVRPKSGLVIFREELHV